MQKLGKTLEEIADKKNVGGEYTMNNYEEILSMLEKIKNNKNALKRIKSFVQIFIQRYC